MSDNPYAPPEAAVETPTRPSPFDLHDPRSVRAGRGVAWLSEGFGHFKAAPGTWILICLVGFALMVVVGLVPFANLINGFFTYVWAAGLLLACKAQDDGEELSVGYLFAGFKRHFGALCLLGVTIAILSSVIMFAAMGPTFLSAMAASTGDEAAAQEFATMMAEDPVGTFLLPFLIGMLVVIPVMMAAWYAPALIMLNDVGVFWAMRMSFVGCLKNVMPLLLYGVVAMVLFVLAAIPLMLGMLVLIPTLFASMYRSYKDIYIET